MASPIKVSSGGVVSTSDTTGLWTLPQAASSSKLANKKALIDCIEVIISPLSIRIVYHKEERLARISFD